MSIEFILQLLINGLLLGAFYATMALGFSTIWGVMRLINLAHGEFLMMGAFVAWFFYNPLREQNLSLSTDNGFTTLLVMGLIALLLGLILSESVLEKKRFPNSWLRRGVCLLASFAVMMSLYTLWLNTGFQPVHIPMMLLVFGGLALSLGLIISHLLLGVGLNWGKLWQRRLIGYSTGAIASLSGFLFWQNLGFPSIDPFLSLPLLFILFFGLGFVLQNGFLNRLVEGPHLTMLLVTFAIGIILQNIGLDIYAADPRRINVTYGTAINVFGSITLPPTKLFMLYMAIAMVIGMALFLRFTRTGYAIRAAAQNKMAARLMGINIHQVYAITFGISLALTGMAGGMMGTFQPITPVDGAEMTLRAFSIVALGGLGKIRGVIFGGLLLGVAESFVGGYINTGWAVAAAFIILVLTLVIRPQGLTGGLVAEEE